MESAESQEVSDRISGADALYVLRQFSGIIQNAFTTVTVRDSKGLTVFCHHLPLNNPEEEWNGWVLAALASYNKQGSIVEYNVNPAINPRRKAISCLSTLVGYFETHRTKLSDRLRQMAILHKARFEPSYVVQWADGLCGVYVLDGQLTVERHKALSRNLARQIDSASVKKSDQPSFSIPLPGFFYKGKVVKLLHPAKPTHVAVRLYSAGEFVNFPELTMENVERFYKEAADLSDERALEFVASLLREARENGDQRAVLIGAVVNKRRSINRKLKDLALGFNEPDKTVIPHFKAVPVKYWNDFWTYVRYGPATNEDVLARLVHRILNATLKPGPEERGLACQGLDRHLIREMIDSGYTCAAVIEFFARPGHNIGHGKDAVYLSQLYNVEITALRTAAKEMSQQEMKVSAHTFDFIKSVCVAIDKIGDAKKLGAAARIDGECLNLNLAKAYAKFYVPEMIAAKKLPLSMRQVKFIFQNCSDHYWLGKASHTERYGWRFSIPQLQRHKLLKTFAPLTN